MTKSLSSSIVLLDDVLTGAPLEWEGRSYCKRLIQHLRVFELHSSCQGWAHLRRAKMAARSAATMARVLLGSDVRYRPFARYPGLLSSVLGEMEEAIINLEEKVA